jgi:valyl-tRNA synthetase
MSSTPSTQLEKVYEPGEIEPRWAKWWVDENLFAADAASPKPVYSLVAPPPNVTGALHMGHMFEIAQTDITMRWKRMCGYNVLWLPGTDHAAIATEMLVTRYLREQGIERDAIGREKFIEHAWAWTKKYGGTIIGQFKRIGASCDWTRERFTLDEGFSRAVRETFVHLYEKGLIYRGEYLVNWCPGCGTAVSDLEVVYSQQQGHLWHIRYPVTPSSGEDQSTGQPQGGFVVVATTRPETMLGDTAVAVNPSDERYKHLWNKTVTLPLAGRKLKVIQDEIADPEFGTGVVKVTPAHDPNDFAAGKRHKLEFLTVIGPDAKMNELAGPYAGLDRYEARKRIVADLEKQGLIEKIEDYSNNIGSCQRCKSVVEPRVSTQWFARMKGLAQPAIEAVESNRIEIIPEQWRRNYFEWMYNIRDWCISRQLWWGHRIPASYCRSCGEVIVTREDPATCPKCGGDKLEQDPDTLDTWFSSGLWPFGTMGWPDDTKDLKTFYPTSLLNTGQDIIFFWVARMIMLGIEMAGDIPFRQVYIHGLVRDADKQKMSKTKGNVIDPIDVTEKYGTDAVRFSLVVAAGQGSDVVLKEERIASARNFANKIWNAARFVFLSLDRSGAAPWMPEDPDAYQLQKNAAGEVPLEDRWIFSRLNETARLANEHIEKFRYHEAANLLYHFFWDEFCDWYLELKKPSFQDHTGLTPEWKNMLAAFECALRLLHPLMPFITEELWQRLARERKNSTKSIALASYPQPNSAWEDPEAERKIELLQQIVTAVRNLRAELSIDPKTLLDGTVFAHARQGAELVGRQSEVIRRLAAAQLEAHEGKAPEGKAMHHEADFDLVLHLPAAEQSVLRDRLRKQLESLEKAKASAERQLANADFVAKAPPHVIESMREKLADYESKIQRIRATLDSL